MDGILSKSYMPSNFFSIIRNFSPQQKIFILLLVVADTYYFYRYLLRYGSNISPSDYQITPFELQAGKFFIIPLFFIILFLMSFYRDKIWKRLSELKIQPFWLVLVFFLLYTTSLLFLGGWDIERTFTQNAKMLFVIPAVFLVPLIWINKEPYTLFKIFLAITIAYHVLYELLMFFSFLVLGKLPALALSNILPRFGGGWDDPNTFSAYVVFFIIMAFLVNFKNKNLEILTLGFIHLCGYMLLFTYSLSGLVGLFTILVLLFLMKRLPAKKLIPLLLAFLIFILGHMYFGTLEDIYKAKAPSTRQHITSVVDRNKTGENVNVGGKVVYFLIGNQENREFNENFYIQIFNNFGLIGLFSFLAVIFTTIIRSIAGYLSLKSNSNTHKKLFFQVSFIYLIAFSFMNNGIPFFQIFPLNLFVWVMIGFVWTLTFKIDKKINKVFGFLPKFVLNTNT